jgi:CRP-like cAMP-binding protein
MAVKLEMFNRERDGISYAAGTRIFSEGDPPDAMYIVIEGNVEITMRGRHLETIGPGEPFGEMALIEKIPRVAAATAKSNVRLVKIEEKRFLFMVQQTPHFALQIMKVMSDRLRRMDSKAVPA